MSTTSPSRGAQRRRPRRESVRPLGIVTIAAVTLIAVGAAMLVGLRAPTGLPLKSYHTLYVSFYDSGNLQPRNEVRINGVRVGQVLDVKAYEGHAVAKLQLDPGTEAVTKDATALLRARGLLGARYVEIVQGRSAAKLADAATIAARPDALKSGVPEALETFNAQTRGGLGTTLRGLGTGLAGRGQQLNDTFRIGRRPGTQFPDLASALLARPGALSRLPGALDRGAAALDDARTAIAGSFAPTAGGLRPFAEEPHALGATIDAAPGTLRSLRTGLQSGTGLLTAVRSLATGAAEVLPAAPRGLREVALLLRESPKSLARADHLVTAIPPVVPPLVTLLKTTTPLLPRVRDALADLDPLAAKVGEYGCEVDNFAENWRSALGFGLDTPSGGTALPSGRVGPVQAFRITLVAGVQSSADLATPKNLFATRTAYPRPCTYSPGPAYPQALGK